MIIFRSHFSFAFEKNPVTTEELPDAYEKDARNRPPGFIPEGRSRYDRSTVPRNGKGRPTVPGIYLLNGNSAYPTEGKLLACGTETFRFAGYHRLELNGSLLLPAGSRIGVVILESVPVSGGIRYALVNTGSMNLKGAEAHNANAGKYGVTAHRYAKGIVNAGESFVSLESGKWMDWADAISVFGSSGSNEGIAYDNLPVKAYIYPLAEVEKVHNLSERIPTNGGEAAICPEDGYLLLDIAK